MNFDSWNVEGAFCQRAVAVMAFISAQLSTLLIIFTICVKAWDRFVEYVTCARCTTRLNNGTRSVIPAIKRSSVLRLSYKTWLYTALVRRTLNVVIRRHVVRHKEVCKKRTVYLNARRRSAYRETHAYCIHLIRLARVEDLRAYMLESLGMLEVYVIGHNNVLLAYTHASRFIPFGHDVTTCRTLFL